MLLPAAQANLVTAHTKVKKTLWVPLGLPEKIPGNFLPEAEGLHRATGEICPRKSGKSYDGNRVLIATSNVHLEELSALRGSPETLLSHFGT